MEDEEIRLHHRTDTFEQLQHGMAQLAITGAPEVHVGAVFAAHLRNFLSSIWSGPSRSNIVYVVSSTSKGGGSASPPPACLRLHRTTATMSPLPFGPRNYRVVLKCCNFILSNCVGT